MLTHALPTDKLVDENGYISDVWEKYFSFFMQQFQENLNQDGFIIPSVSTAHANMTAGNKFIGNIVYDEERNIFVANVNGALFSVNLTAL